MSKHEEDKTGFTFLSKQTPEGEPEDLTAPDSTIPTASSALTIYDRLKLGSSKRLQTFAKIQGMIDGNPPYRKDVLSRHGLQSLSNVNWRDAEAIFEGVAIAYWSLFNEVENIAVITTIGADPNAAPEISKIISEEFDRLLRGWDRFTKVMTEHQSDLIKFGSSVLMWTDERDWRCEVVDIDKFFVPEKTLNDTKKFNLCALEHTMSAQELWDIYSNLKGDEDEKWNKEAIGELLLSESLSYRTNTSSSANAVDFMELQRRIRNGDTCVEAEYSDDIEMVSVLSREFDGTVSRGIFTRTLTAGNEKGDWLFRFKGQYEEMHHAIQAFSFAPGEKFFHGNKGIGTRIFNTVTAITQLDNTLLDTAKRAGTLLIRSKTGRNKDAKPVEFKLGGITDIGEAEFVQSLFGTNIGSSVDASRYFRQKMEYNNNTSGSFMTHPDARPRSAQEVRQTATREAKVQKNKIAYYYEQLDIFLREVLSKALRSKPDYPGYDDVKKFKERCIQRGVPEELLELTKENEDAKTGLPDHLSIRATRASGSGSQVADQQEMQIMMQILPTLGERGRNNVLRDFIAANRGHQYLDFYMPPEDRTEQPTGDDTIASIENNQLEKGESVVVSPDNNHAVHCQRHMQRMEQIAQTFQEAEGAARDAGSETPSVDASQYGPYGLTETDTAFQTLGPHFVRHMLFLQQDPTRSALARELSAKWAILANFGDKIANNAQEHRQAELRKEMKAQREMDSMDAEERVAMRKVELDSNIKMAKLRADIQRGATRDSLQHSLNIQKVAHKNQIDKLQAMSKIGLDAQKTVAEETKGKEESERT